MKKTTPAFLAALLITILLGAGMFVVGQNSLSASPAQAAPETITTLTSENLAQLEQVIAKYQARETEYQTELDTAIERLNTANQQLSQADQQIQAYEDLLAQLQNSGLITMNSDGTVMVNQSFLSPRGDHVERGEHPERTP